MAIQAIDREKAEAFAGEMGGMLNGAALVLMINIGHQTNLFDTMAELPPSTSMEIAAAANLSERYVREWLGSMASGHIVDYDPSAATFALPPEHAAFLTRAAGTDNMAIFAVELTAMSEVEPHVVQCFRNGGGVPYSEFPRFQALQAEESGAVYDATLVSTVLPLVDGLIARLEQGIDVLDVGSGMGHAINVMAKAFPNSRFVGYDLSAEGVAAGHEEASALGLANASFSVSDVAKLDGSRQFDLIMTFDVIHDLAHPETTLRGIHRSLRPGGIFLMAKIAASSHLENNLDHPLAPALYTISTLHCMTVSLSQDGDGLGTVWGDERIREMLTKVGFTKIDAREVPGDILNRYYIMSP